MLLSLIVLILVGAIAYFHYVEGFFSATLSAFLAIVAAVFAFSFHEVLVRALLQGKVADQAHSLMLVALFAATYTVLRVVFDSAVPGNIRLPVLLDKIGAGAMGVVAGVFAVGILIIAAQMLPFGPSIAGYARYATIPSQDVQISGARAQVDSYVIHALKSDSFDPNDKSRLLIPVDDIVVGTTRHLSDGGSLAGPQSLTAVHPAFLDEVFAQRLGVQTGAKHVAYNLSRDRQVELRGLYTLDTIPQADGEVASMKNRWVTAPPPQFKSDNQNILLIARLMFTRNASDSDNNIRVSPGAVRLAVGGRNYFPIGNLQLDEGPIVRANRPDDFLILGSDGVVDFVFSVPREALGLDADPKNRSAGLTVAPNVFIEAKRMGFVDLSGVEVKREVPEKPGATVMRKKELPGPKVAPGTGATAAKEAAGPIDFGRLLVSSEIFTPVNVGAFEGDVEITFASGKAKLREKKFERLEVDPTQSLQLLRTGDAPIKELWAPAGHRVVQVVAVPASSVQNKWEWADKLGEFELVDNAGTAHKPRGAVAKVKQGTSDRVVARYNAEAQVSDLPTSGETRPTDLWLIFVVPENSTIKELRFAGKRIKSLDQPVG